MLLAKPGCYAFLGNGDGGHRDSGHGAGPCMLHNASYDFNDELLPIGSTYWVRLAQRFLAARQVGFVFEGAGAVTGSSPCLVLVALSG